MVNINFLNNKPLCRITGETLIPIIDFGQQPLGNGFLLQENFKNEFFYQMQIGFSKKSFMLQLIEQPKPEQMFHENYAFHSSTSSSMEMHFREFARSIIDSEIVNKNPFVVELGCNDGILLRHFAEEKIRHLGIEPSKNVAKLANKQGVRTISEFFSEELAQQILKNDGPVDVFLAANVMCHIPDIRSVVRGIKIILKKTGLVQFEDPYFGDIIEKTSYDQIYDEHVYLFSAHSVKYLFGLEGLELIDVQPQKTHGGSMRYTLANQGCHTVKNTVFELLEKEKNLGLDRQENLLKFKEKVEQSRNDLVNLLKKLKMDGKRVAGYGATSKSTTILNYCGIGPDLIEYICDTTPTKQEKLTPGMHIPVRHYSYFQQNPPDYTFLFAWNHVEEIMAKEHGFIQSGGKWITHVPKVQIL